MVIESKEKFANIVKQLVVKAKSRRAFAREFGVSASAVIHWEQGVIPDTDNLIKIASMAGYTFEEFQEMLYGKSLSKPRSVDEIIRQIRNLAPKDLALVIKASADELAGITA
jgi:transcriptional regulator with XRE-family HTH domain